MDFRTVSVPGVQWVHSWYRGQPVARCDGQRVTVQTPLTPCRVHMAGRGMYRLDLVFRDDVDVHVDFVRFVQDLETSAGEDTALRDWAPGDLSRCVFNGSMRLMVFSDTLTFDDQGKLSADLMDAAACQCLIELQGIWKTESKWGIRWKVVQVKFAKESTFPVRYDFLDD